MYKKLFYTIILLFASMNSSIYAQNKRYFENTDWFVDNRDSSFYNNDTLKLIKHTNYGPKWSSDEYAEYEMKYLNHGEFIEISFKKFNKLNFNWRKNNYIYIIPINQWRWKFDKKNNIILLFDNLDNLIISFKPIKEKTIEIDSKFAGEGKLTTTEITLVRINQ